MEKLRPNVGRDLALASFAGVLSLLIIDFFNIGILRISESDFLTAFPNRDLSQMLGRQFLYEGSLAQSWMGDAYWQYGPLHQFMTVPLYAFSSVENATSFLLGFNCVMLLATYLRFLDLFRISLKSKLTLIPMAVLMLIYPTFSALNQRNLEVIEMYLIAVALESATKGKLFRSGVIVGLAVGIKFLPAIVILPWILSRKVVPLLGFSLALLPQVILAQLLFGWERNWVWKLLRDGEEETIPLRQGLADVILRIVGDGNSNINFFYILLVLIIFLCLIFRFNRYPDLSQTSNLVFTWPFLLGLICLIPPHSNNYYYVFFGPLVLWLYLELKGSRWIIGNTLFVIALFLISIPAPLALLWRLVEPGNVEKLQNLLNQVLSLSPMFFGGAVLTSLSWLLFIRSETKRQRS